MTNVEFLKRLCEGYVRSYRTFNLHTTNRWTDLTQRELDFFRRLGEMLGFAARLEDRRMDLSWREPDSEDLVLHLERETKAYRVRKTTIPKLLQSEQSQRAPYLGAVLGWVREQDLLEVRDTITGKLADRSLFLIAWVGPTQEDAEDLKAFVFGDSGVLARRGKGLRDADDFWYAHFLEPWRPEVASI